jgi:hypothetical protein
MSKVSNVHSGHYKVAGRGRQGEGLLQEQQKRAFVTQRESARVQGNEEQAGLPAWEVTPPNLETEAEPAAPARKTSKKRPKRAKTAKRKATARRRPVVTRKRPARQSGARSAKRRTRR